MEAILALLAEHEAMAYEQIAHRLGEPPERVRVALDDLRARGLVDAVTVGRLEGALTNAVSYWRLTAKGREDLGNR